jgi:AcrR family transcriptional regulator
MQVPPERDALLARLRPYVDEHGLGALDFDRLAEATGVSAHELRASFGTKEKLAAALVASDRSRGRAAIERIDRESADWNELIASIWRYYFYEEKAVRRLFESLGLTFDDDEDRRFVHGVDGWLDLLESMLLRDGVEAQRARALATLVVAVQRGALMDVFATGERARVSAAMQMWSEAVGSLVGKR